jgi:hypothetical protein
MNSPSLSLNDQVLSMKRQVPSARALLEGLPFAGECPMTLNAGQIAALVVRMQGEFLDAPTLKLTLPEAERRFQVDRVTCEAVLGALVDAHVLARTRDGFFVRFFPRLAHAA